MNEFLTAYHGKTVLISGAGGYLGSALAQALNGADCRLTLTARRLPDDDFLGQGSAEVTWLERDLAEEFPWERELDDVDVIFHLAANEHRRGAPFMPLEDERVNVRAVLCLLETLRERKRTPRIVFASTSNVAGLAQSMPVNEESIDRPLTLFAVHKLTAEKYLQYYARTAGIPGVALRLANLYGTCPNPAANDRPVLNRMAGAALRGDGLTVYRNRGCQRDFLYLADAVQVFLAAGVRALPADGLPHVIGSGEAVTLKQAAETIAAAAERLRGMRVDIVQDDHAALDAVEWRNFVADSSRFQAVSGWVPQTAFADGIFEMMEAMV